MFQKYPCWVIKTSTDQWMIQNHYDCNRNIRYHTTIYYIYNKKTDHVYTSHLRIGSSFVAMFPHVPWPHAVATWRSRDKKNSIDESTPLKNQRNAMKFCEIVWFFVFWGFCWLPSGKLEQKLSRRFRESQIIFSWAKQNLEQRFHHFAISRMGTIYIYSIFFAISIIGFLSMLKKNPTLRTPAGGSWSSVRLMAGSFGCASRDPAKFSWQSYEKSPQKSMNGWFWKKGS
jgi:hypothetical protein